MGERLIKVWGNGVVLRRATSFGGASKRWPRRSAARKSTALGAEVRIARDVVRFLERRAA